MLRVGLTGGIACGKSAVLGRLRARGLATLDLDSVAHDVMAPGGAAYHPVVEVFGTGILGPDGTIDRHALGAVVFTDARARTRLDAIVHPRVREEETRRAARFEAEGRELLVSDAALLVEAGVHLRFDRLVVVYCAPQEQRRRLMARDGMDEPAARARIDAQMPVEEKRRFAHLEVDTSGSLGDTEVAAEVLAGILLTEARGPRPTHVLARARALGALAHFGARGPRGLGPRTFLETVSHSGGMELPALGRRLEPPEGGRWYRVARPDEREPWPEALAAALAVWGLAQKADEEWLAGAAASLGRLTHVANETIAGTVLAALLALGVARAGDLRALQDRSGEREGRSCRWGGAPPSRRIRRALEAALAHPADPIAAGEAALENGAEPGFAAALVGMAVGLAPGDADPALATLVDRLS